MKKISININNFGHYNPLTLQEFINYFKVIFKKFKINLSVSNVFNKKINIFFEGQHPLFRKRFLEIINQSSNVKKGIILTELVYGSNFLSTKYFTFNNRTLNKNINNQIFSLVYLIYLNLTYYFIQILKKTSWSVYQRIKFKLKDENNKNLLFVIFYKFFSYFFSELDNANGIYYWKERYNFFHNILKNIDFIINITGHEKEYHQKFNNYHKISFLSTGKKSNTKLFNKKKIDCLFTGQLTDYRNKILNNLKNEGIRIQYHNYLEEKKRKKVLDNSKIYLCLNKFKDDNLPLGTRAWHCLENGIFFVAEKNNIKKKILEKFSINVDNEDFTKNIKNILNNYNYYLKEYSKKLAKYKKKKFYKNIEILNLINYIRKI